MLVLFAASKTEDKVHRNITCFLMRLGGAKNTSFASSESRIPRKENNRSKELTWKDITRMVTGSFHEQ